MEATNLCYQPVEGVECVPVREDAVKRRFRLCPVLLADVFAAAATGMHRGPDERRRHDRGHESLLFMGVAVRELLQVVLLEEEVKVVFW